MQNIPDQRSVSDAMLDSGQAIQSAYVRPRLAADYGPYNISWRDFWFEWPWNWNEGDETDEKPTEKSPEKKTDKSVNQGGQQVDPPRAGEIAGASPWNILMVAGLIFAAYGVTRVL